MSAGHLLVLTLNMPSMLKRLLVMCLDVSFCVLTVWIAFYLRLGEWIQITGDLIWQPQRAVVGSLIFAMPIFVFNRLYQSVFRYSGRSSLIAISKAMAIYSFLYATVFTVIGIDNVPRTVGLIQPMLLFLTVSASRMYAQFLLVELNRRVVQRVASKRVLIYGAGNAGRQLLNGLLSSQITRVVGFIDDDPRLQGRTVDGLPVHSIASFLELAAELRIDMVLLALPTVNRKRRNEIISRIQAAKISVRTLPSLVELALGNVSVYDLRDLEIDDLLGREPAIADELLLSLNVVDKIVLVTGAGGSIGSELCRQIMICKPKRLVLIEQSEYALYRIHQELLRRHVGCESVLLPIIASVREKSRMSEIISTWRPHTVYHAAAYKHVPLVEHNPAEGIKNNVFGTLVTASAAVTYGVSNFVLISTDKAVRPTNIMGASKRVAELIVQALADKFVGSECDSTKNKHTIFSIVRFGNVLGSSGSVVPKFRQQISSGGPITLTHLDVTRYFMSIPEAAQLVIQAGALARGGEVFVLDMLEPIKIRELAIRMIELSGLTIRDTHNPDGDIDILVTGLRPGEKLYEELLIGDDPMPTVHPRILMAREHFLNWMILEKKLNELENKVNINDIASIKELLQSLVSGYAPIDEIADWVTVEKTNQAQMMQLAQPHANEQTG